MEILLNRIACAFMFVLMGLFAAIGLIIFPLFMLMRLFGFIPKTDRDMIEEVERVYKAFEESDIQFLEDYAQSHPNFPHGTDDWLKQHWLTNAIDVGSVGSVQWVLDQGVEVNYHDADGTSPLTSAIQREHDSKYREWEPSDAAEIIDMLMAKGADINAGNSLEITALHNAAAWGSVEMVQHLLDRGADPDAMDCEYLPGNPLSYVNKRKHPEVAALLERYMGTNQKA